MEPKKVFLRREDKKSFSVIKLKASLSKHNNDNDNGDKDMNDLPLECYFQQQIHRNSKDSYSTESLVESFDNGFQLNGCSVEDYNDDDKMEKLFRLFIDNYNAQTGQLSFVRIINFLSKHLHFDRHFDFITSSSQHSFMFDLHFDANGKKFHRILKYLFRLLNEVNNVEKFHIQFSHELLWKVSSQLEESLKLYSANSYSFGSMVRVDKFFSRFEASHVGPIIFKPASKDIYESDIELLIHFLKEQQILRIVWKSDQIKRLIIQKTPTSDRVFFELDCAPLYYKYKGEATTESFDLFKSGSYAVNDWERLLEFSFEHEGKQFRFNRDIVGLSRTVCVAFDEPEQGNIFDVLRTILDRMKSRNTEHGRGIPVYASKVETIPSERGFNWIESILNALSDIPFSVQFALRILFTNSFKAMDTMIEEASLWDFLKEVQAICNEKDKNKITQMVAILTSLASTIEDEPFLNVRKEFQRLMDDMGDIFVEVTSEKHDVFRTIQVYPSHIRYLPPKSILQSRFSKQAQQEYSLRVELCDDGGCHYGFDDHKFLTAHAKQALQRLIIGDREYSVLAASMSQVRECSATFYATDEQGRTAVDIRMNAGNFNNAGTLAKLMSKMSLIFSQSLCIFDLPENVVVRTMVDLLGNWKPEGLHNKKEQHLMTDGIGYYPKSVANIFHREILKSEQFLGDYVPSAYQIRYKGYKGMLAFNPKLKGSTVFFRPSQKKYLSNDKRMCLLKYSYPRPAKLNVPVIMILADAHGVDPFEFYMSFQQSSHGITNAALSENKAAVFLRNLSQAIFPWDRIYNAGISILNEPFLRSVLYYLMTYRLEEDLKSKMRLYLSPEKARCGFGVVDETKQLKAGQVFFQATQLDDKKMAVVDQCKVITGKVMLFRNPAMQPGDVRVFDAVDIPELHHLRDVVVFPVQGERSHADELSGGDYDGDEFVIIWDSKMIIEKNMKPMDFPYGQSGSKKLEEGDQVTENDFLDHLLKCFQENEIGKTATRHLKVADYHPRGLYSKQCETLAHNYNIMLDAAKTGYSQTKKDSYWLSHDPDYKVTSSLKKRYLSRKMPGQLYRQASLLKRIMDISNASLSSTVFKPLSQEALLNNPFVISDWTVFRKQASSAFTNYKLDICKLLDQARLTDEAIVFTECFDQEGFDITDQMQKLMLKFGNLFDKQTLELKLDHVGQLVLASAWYSICLEAPIKFKHKDLMGLPWLIPHKMIDLARYLREHGHPTCTPVEVEGVTTYNFESLAKSIQNPAPVVTSVRSASEFLAFDNEAFQFKKWQVIKDDLYACYLKKDALNSLLSNDEEYVSPDVLIQFHQAIANINKMVAFQTVAMLFQLIRQEIYHFDSFVVYENDVYVDQGKSINETIWRRISELTAMLSKNQSRIPTASTIINIFFLYLHNLISNVNPLIKDIKLGDNLDDVFLLKYAVFASVFIQKVDSAADKQLLEKLSEYLYVPNNRQAWIELLKQENAVKALKEAFFKAPDFKPQVELFQKTICNHYQSELKSNMEVKKSHKERFAILPLKYDFDERHLNMIAMKFRFLSGVNYADLKTGGDPYPPLPDERYRKHNNHKQQTQQVKHMIEATVAGAHVNLDLFKTLAASPDVFRNVIPAFNIQITHKR